MQREGERPSDIPIAGTKVITLLTCKAPEESTEKIYWMKDGKIVTSDRNRINIMPNGTMVLTDVEVKLFQHLCIYNLELYIDYFYFSGRRN